MNRFNIYAFADEAGSELSEQISAMTQNGLQGLEIRGIGGKNVTELTVKEATDIKEKLDASGLKVWSVGSPIGKIGIRDNFAPHLELFRHTLELASILEAENIRLFSFFIDKNESYQSKRSEVMDRIEAFIKASEGYPVTLCHENEKGIYGDIASRCEEIHRTFPSVKAVFDPANFIQTGQDTLSAWKLLSPYVKYLHIKDALSDGSVVPAGKGSGNLREIIGEYAAAGGRSLTIEPHLTVFKGLGSLEKDGARSDVGRYSYSSQRSAFDAAVSALQEII